VPGTTITLKVKTTSIASLEKVVDATTSAITDSVEAIEGVESADISVVNDLKVDEQRVFDSIQVDRLTSSDS